MTYIEEKLKKLNFKDITPIQKEVFKHINNKNNIVGISKTGTGKTHAYLLPILEKLKLDDDKVFLVICVPTNELVIQVTKMIKDIDENILVKSYYGSIDKQKEFNWLEKRQPQIVVATPNKLVEYVVVENKLKIHTAKYFILDEADMMFDEDFLKMIDQIISKLTAKYLLFSASITKSMEPFIKEYFGSYLLLDTTKIHDIDIEHRLIKFRFADRIEVLKEVIPTINPFLCFIFVSKKEDQEKVYEAVKLVNDKVLNFDTKTGVKNRKKMIDEIIKLKYQYVVTSDLIARGMDFKASHIINYDLPYHLDFFMHRSGRTGRMNTSGIVITLAAETDSRKTDKLKKQGIKFNDYKIVNKELVKIEKRVDPNKLDEIALIKQIKKPTKVAPNYKKKNKEKIQSLKKQVRSEMHYAKNRKPH